jgi:predicted transcriptional regulator
MTKFEIMLPEAASGAIDSLARQTGQTREHIVQRAIETYVEGLNRWHADMERALADVDRDIGHDGEAVLAWVESWSDGHTKPIGL